MPLLSTNVLVAIAVSTACLVLVLSGTAKGQRVKLVVGGVGIAALMVAAALIADAFLA